MDTLSASAEQEKSAAHQTDFHVKSLAFVQLWGFLMYNSLQHGDPEMQGNYSK